MEDKLVVVGQFETPENAHFAKIDLEGAGIDAVIENDVLPSIGLFYTMPTCSVKLLVRERDVEQAHQVLRDVENEPAIGETDTPIFGPDEQDDLVCPACGSSKVSFETWSRKWFFWGWLLFRFPLPKRTNQSTCRDCGHQWKNS
jgi:DNA-directed RNA polymerase subunit RPC12/RpoP